MAKESCSGGRLNRIPDVGPADSGSPEPPDEVEGVLNFANGITIALKWRILST